MLIFRRSQLHKSSSEVKKQLKFCYIVGSVLSRMMYFKKKFYLVLCSIYALLHSLNFSEILIATYEYEWRMNYWKIIWPKFLTKSRLFWATVSCEKFNEDFFLFAILFQSRLSLQCDEQGWGTIYIVLNQSIYIKWQGFKLVINWRPHRSS